MSSLNDTVEEGELEEGEIGDDSFGKESEDHHKVRDVNLNSLGSFTSVKRDSSSRKSTELILMKNKRRKKSTSLIKKEIYRDRHVCHLKEKHAFSLPKVKYSSSEKRNPNNNVPPKRRFATVGSRPIPHPSTRPKWYDHKTRNLNTSQDISYEDLLNQYKQIQSKVETFGRRKSDSKSENKYRTEKDKKSSKGERVNSEKENNQKQHLNCSKYSKRKKSNCKEVSKACSKLKKSTDKTRLAAYVQYKKKNVAELTVKNSDKTTVKKEEEEDEYVLRMKALASRNNLGLNKIKQIALDKAELDKSKDLSKESTDDISESRDKEKIDDNYDLVDMELDSDVETFDSPCLLTISNNLPKNQEDDDVDEEELRHQLLAALAKRKKQPNSVNSVNDSENLNESSFVQKCEEETIQLNGNQNIPENLPAVYNGNIMVSTTNQQSLVINLEDDSSDASDCYEFEDNQDSSDISVQAGLEKLLKEARMESDRKFASIASSLNSIDTSDNTPTTNIGNTPAAVYRLSRAQQLEYRKLKELIAKKESTRATDMTKSHLLKQTYQRLPQFEAKLNICNATLRKENLLMKLLRMHINKKKLVLRDAQMNVQKLKQQLAGAEKVVGQNLQVIHKLNMQLKTVQLSAERRSCLIAELEKECTNVGVQLFGASYKLPLSSLLPLS